MENLTFIIYTFDQNLFEILRLRLISLGVRPIDIYWSLKPWLVFFDKNPNFIIVDESFLLNNSFDFCKFIKNKYNLPILVILNNSYVFERNLIQNCSFIKKSFLLTQLDLKITSMLFNHQENLFFKNDKFIINVKQSESIVEIESKKIYLTKTEFYIFSYLLKLPNLRANKTLLLKIIWGYDDIWSLKSNILEMHISKMRRKFSPLFKNVIFLIKKDSSFQLFH